MSEIYHTKYKEEWKSFKVQLPQKRVNNDSLNFQMI